MPGFDVLNPELDLKRNYFIEASAGTGKTFTIENTVVRLIQDQVPVDQILVVTFTRAATLELKTRIRHNLEAKKMKKELLAFDDARVFTIHGFCFHTLKEYALETGFSLLQKEESSSPDILKRIFKDFMRTELTFEEIHPKQLQQVMILHQNSPDKLLKALLQPQIFAGRSFSEIFEDIDKEIQCLLLDKNSVFESLMKCAPFFSKMCDRKKQIKSEVVEGLERFSRLFEKIEINDLFELPILKMIPENLLGKNEYPQFLEQLNRKLIPLLAELSNSEMILGYLKNRFQLFLNNVCQREDLFFYDDLLRTMQKCVHKFSFAEKVRAHYQIVLIDEFQDTDRLQWDIFSTLFLGRRPLYLVGDPKQSIYRFRGADLYTYMEAKEAMGSEAYVTLTHNYRFEPGLVDALNSLFSKAADLITLPRTGESISIPPIVAARPKTDLEGKIIFCRTPNESSFFSFIISEIEQLHQQWAVPYEEFAVLVKDHYQAKRFCLQCTLPFITKKNTSLLETESFSILEDLLFAAYNPRNREMVLKALGGPLFEIPLEELSLKGDEKIELFHHYHQILHSKGILSFFRAVTEDICFSNEDLYFELLQLVELIAENTFRFEEYIPFLQKLKLTDPESERLKVRAKIGIDAIQVMTTHVAKGLEFEFIFPVGLMSAYEMKDEEEVSEVMRQMYVALTRAKKRLYLPLSEQEKSPMHCFLKHILKDQSLEVFIQDNPHFSLVACEPTLPQSRSFGGVQSKLSTYSSAIVKPKLAFQSMAIHSYTSLSEQKDYDPTLPQSRSFGGKLSTYSSTLMVKNPEALQDPVLQTLLTTSDMPPGAKTGVLLHQIFEHLDFEKKENNLRDFIANQIKETHLEPWLSTIETLVKNALYFPLCGQSGDFCLADVDSKKIKRELEFLYTSEYPKGYIKGFVDLFFEYQNYFYIVDWKSNLLESYASEGLQKAINFYDYHLQAELYKTAALRYLRLFNAEEKFAGIFFVFLRGLNLEKREGVFRFNAHL